MMKFALKSDLVFRSKGFPFFPLFFGSYIKEKEKNDDIKKIRIEFKCLLSS
jgi:hypothetical protein